MNIKKFKIISVFIIFIFCFFTHNGYSIFNNFLGSLLFPINESLFEHIKVIFTSYIVYFIIEWIYLNNYNNIKSNFFIEITANILNFYIIYLPIYLLFDHNLILTLLILFISIAITQYISYKILISNKYNNLNKYFIFILIIYFIILSILTYFPIKSNFFIDKLNNKLGFKNYYEINKKKH